MNFLVFVSKMLEQDKQASMAVWPYTTELVSLILKGIIDSINNSGLAYGA